MARTVAGTCMDTITSINHSTHQTYLVIAILTVITTAIQAFSIVMGTAVVTMVIDTAIAMTIMASIILGFTSSLFFDNRFVPNLRMAIHHKIARSRGGSDDEWNLEELSPFSHAYEHALDFVLFPEISPQFDFRQPGWPLLPEDLQLLVRQETSRRRTGNQIAVGHGGPKGERNGNYGKSPCKGRVRPQSERSAISEKLTGVPKSPEHRQKLREVKLGTKTGPQPPNNPNRIEGAKRGWETRRQNQQQQK